LPAIEVDPVLLEQALVNVIDNALIHTPAGSRIEIGSTHAGSTVRLWVEDSGAGVDPAELKQIFDKFYRPAGSGHAAGLGLGLAITKALVEAMDGTVSASGAANGESGLRIEFAFRATSVSEVA
jgi:two-component system sensor histidine kinase KdpD